MLFVLNGHKYAHNVIMYIKHLCTTEQFSGKHQSSKNQEEHGRRLRHALERVEAANVTLNPSKCEFSKVKVKFLVHVIDPHDIRADPNKTGAIQRR